MGGFHLRGGPHGLNRHAYLPRRGIGIIQTDNALVGADAEINTQPALAADIAKQHPIAEKRHRRRFFEPAFPDQGRRGLGIPNQIEPPWRHLKGVIL